MADELEPGLGTVDSARVVAELRAALERATDLLHHLQHAAPAPRPQTGETPADGQIAELKRRLDDAETDLSEVSDRLVETENQRGKLMNLYVATYQLHATLDQSEVTATIAEIARDLLGAERFALLLREEEGSACEVLYAEGFDPEDLEHYSGGRYGGGDPLVDETLTDGILRLGEAEGSETLAVVPLRVQGTVVGALVVLKLFDHKASLTADDRDLLDLLAAHAASALFAARVYSRTDRKLRTLESLVKLVQ